MNPGIPKPPCAPCWPPAGFNEAGAMNPGIRNEIIQEFAQRKASMRPGL